MSAHDTATWLLDWFAARNPASATASDRMTANYFEAGWIDSLGVVELIADAEDHFHIRFTENDFQDRRFSTITGLVEIIGERHG
jgi:D-alanine--poly(phosphoribitol) ligase subunit 2